MLTNQLLTFDKTRSECDFRGRSSVAPTKNLLTRLLRLRDEPVSCRSIFFLVQSAWPLLPEAEWPPLVISILIRSHFSPLYAYYSYGLLMPWSSIQRGGEENTFPFSCWRVLVHLFANDSTRKLRNRVFWTSIQSFHDFSSCPIVKKSEAVIIRLNYLACYRLR